MLIAFDLDGVLYDGETMHFNALSEAIEQCTDLLREEYRPCIAIDGSTTKSKLTRLALEFSLSQYKVTEIDACKQAIVDREITNIQPRLDLQAMLQSLRNQHHTLALVSNSRRTTVDAVLQGLGITKYFSIVATPERHKAKPSPSMYQVVWMVIDRYDEMLILEDSTVGVAAAKSSGAHVFVIDDYYTPETLNYVIKQITDNCCAHGRQRQQIFYSRVLNNQTLNTYSRKADGGARDRIGTDQGELGVHCTKDTPRTVRSGPRLSRSLPWR